MVNSYTALQTFRERHKKDLEIRRLLFASLKGAYTATATPEGNVYFNSSGNPGLATAGSGDVLTGIITSLLSQGQTPFHAAILGVYLHGLAGDLAKDELGEQGMIASDITEFLPYAFRFIQEENV